MPDKPTFQQQVGHWVDHTFGLENSTDVPERTHRFLEEAAELAQASGCTAQEAHQIVDYVFSRPVGNVAQETGGVMITLAALSNANGVSMDAAAQDELRRVWTLIAKIRQKNATKPRFSPLPGVCA